MNDLLITGTSFLLAIMSVYVLFEMVRINRILKMFEIDKLKLIPVMFSIFYMWQGIWYPEAEFSRLVFRFVMFASLSIASLTLYSYSRILRDKGGK